MLHKQPRLLGELKFPPKVDLMLGDGSKAITVLTCSRQAGTRTPTDNLYAMEGPMDGMHAEPKPQDALLYPNYYDCEWLGSSADRLRIHVGMRDCRAVNEGRVRRLVRRRAIKKTGRSCLTNSGRMSSACGRS